MFFIEHARRTSAFTMTRTHFHEALEIYYLREGQRDYFIKNRTYRVEAGSLVFIDSFDVHRTIETGSFGHERILIHFSSDLLKAIDLQQADLLRLPFLHKFRCLSLNMQQRSYVEELLRQIHKEYSEPQEGSDLLAVLLLGQLLVTSSRLMKQQKNKISGHTSARHQKIYDIVQYIRNHYKEPLTLTGVSARFYFHPAYLSRVFKEVTGFTFVEYVNNLRIAEAQRMLRDSDQKVIRIAEEAGFNSIAHFGRVFKRVARMSPIQYRRSEDSMVP